MNYPRLTEPQISALLDAYKSEEHGGMEEVTGQRGAAWVGAHPECLVEHSPIVISWLHFAGLVERKGPKPCRTARITQKGEMEARTTEAFGGA